MIGFRRSKFYRVVLFFSQLVEQRLLPLLSVVVCCAVLTIAKGVSGQASPYVSVMDSGYDYLDALVAVGLVEVPSLIQRPYSRLAFSEFIKQARSQLDLSPQVGERFREAVIMLEQEFADEIGLQCGNGISLCSEAEAPPAAVLREVWLDFTVAASPERAMRTAYSDKSFIDGVLNPLLQRNFGRDVSDGVTLGLEPTLDIQLTPYLSAQLKPRAWIARPRGVSEVGDLTLLDGYLRGVFRGFALEIGRHHLLRGRGRDGGSMLSNNSRGLDMVRVSRESPWRLPWLFRFLGPVSGAAWVADSGGERFIPHSKLIGFDLGARPTQNLEFGLSLLNHQGGNGAPNASWGDRLRDIFLVMPAGAEISDKILSADIVLTFPKSGIELFVSALSTDPDYVFSDRLAETWWDEAIWVSGLKWSGLGPEGRIDLWIEGRHSGLRPHTHHQFRSGLTLDDRVLGDPLGPLANSWQSGIAWTSTKNVFQFEVFREMYSGDDWENKATHFEWVRVSDNSDEIRHRFSADWTRNHLPSRTRTFIRLGYEQVTRFDYTNINRWNYLAQIGIAWAPS